MAFVQRPQYPFDPLDLALCLAAVMTKLLGHLVVVLQPIELPIDQGQRLLFYRMHVAEADDEVRPDDVRAKVGHVRTPKFVSVAGS